MNESILDKINELESELLEHKSELKVYMLLDAIQLYKNALSPLEELLRYPINLLGISNQACRSLKESDIQTYGDLIFKQIKIKDRSGRAALAEIEEVRRKLMYEYMKLQKK